MACPEGRADLGRAGDPPNRFCAPGLRAAAATAPYMHDSSVATLCEAVRPHALDAEDNPAAPLSARQRSDVVAFLDTLVAPEAAPASTNDSRCTDP